jgi:hypothetical protein
MPIVNDPSNCANLNSAASKFEQKVTPPAFSDGGTSRGGETNSGMAAHAYEARCQQETGTH